MHSPWYSARGHFTALSNIDDHVYKNKLIGHEFLYIACIKQGMLCLIREKRSATIGTQETCHAGEAQQHTAEKALLTLDCRTRFAGSQ